jgi:hypothetical protein
VSLNLELTIREAVWLFPACVAAHFLEEAFGFAKWARRHISPYYSDAHWRRVHGTGFVSAIAVSALVSGWPHPVSVFLFTAIFLTPMVFNALFHLATSVFFRSYSPGAASALVLFPALCCCLASISSDAGLLSARSAMAATVVGAAFHTMDLAFTTFFLRRRPRV